MNKGFFLENNIVANATNQWQEKRKMKNLGYLGSILLKKVAIAAEYYVEKSKA